MRTAILVTLIFASLSSFADATEKEKYHMSNISNICACQIVNTKNNPTIICKKENLEVTVEICQETTKQPERLMTLYAGDSSDVLPTILSNKQEGFCLQAADKDDQYITIELSKLQHPKTLFVINARVNAEGSDNKIPIIVNSDWIAYKPNDPNNSCAYQGPTPKNIYAIAVRQ